MAKIEITKETAVKSILSDLKKGIGKEIIMQQIAKKCNKDRTTLHRWYKVAEKSYLKFKEKADPIIEAKEIEALGDKAKQGILSKLERQKILSDIASGQVPVIKHIVCNGVIQEVEVLPDWQSRKGAIAELNKMDGDYAPIKSDLTTNGKEIQGTIIKWGDSEITV